MLNEKFTRFFQLTKWDETTGIATGVAACEEVDHDGEMLDYEGSKPYFQKWSATQQAASGGKSYGNIRLQHDPKRPAGLLPKPIIFDDKNKQVIITAQIVDPTAKAMLASGVLTGFSIGGDYIRKTPMLGGVVRYIASPGEISVCDRPCSPSAVFTAVKADGTIELRKFLPESAKNDSAIRIAKAAGWSDTYICEQFRVTPGMIWQVLRKTPGLKFGKAIDVRERRRVLIEQGRIVR